MRGSPYMSRQFLQDFSFLFVKLIAKTLLVITLSSQMPKLFKFFCNGSRLSAIFVSEKSLEFKKLFNVTTNFHFKLMYTFFCIKIQQNKQRRKKKQK